jgi:hypothetical protein
LDRANACRPLPIVSHADLIPGILEKILQELRQYLVVIDYKNHIEIPIGSPIPQFVALPSPRPLAHQGNAAADGSGRGLRLLGGGLGLGGIGLRLESLDTAQAGFFLHSASKLLSHGFGLVTNLRRMRQDLLSDLLEKT